MQKKYLVAYSLVEIIVVVSILGIIALLGSSVDFSRMTSKQKTAIELIRIKSIFEEVRNNAFLGKAVGNENIIPESWKIEFSRSGSGQITSHYMSGTWMSYEKSWSAKNPFEMVSIICENLSSTLTGSLTGTNTGSLIFTGSQMSFSGPGCEDQNYKILSFQVKNGDINQFLEVNTVTGVLKLY